jgi:hypothetical protein
MKPRTQHRPRQGAAAGDSGRSGRFLILGAGRFGRLAWERLRRRRPEAEIVVVDRDRPPGLVLEGPRGGFIAAEALAYLDGIPQLAEAADWIVPAVPVHVAGEWVRRQLARRGPVRRLPVPEALLCQVPNPLRGQEGQLYVSNADFLCPDDCPEPERICSVTGQPRPRVMWRHLARLEIPGFTPVVVRSRQLAPGVGGFRPSGLQAALARIQTAPGPVLLATACKCHGVVEALTLSH